MTVTLHPRHRAWCPARTSPQFGCYCRNGRLSDPRPEVVEAEADAVAAAGPGAGGCGS